MPKFRLFLVFVFAALAGLFLSACVAGRVSAEKRKEITRLHVAWELGDGIQYAEPAMKATMQRAKIGPCAELEGFVAAVSQALTSRGYTLVDKAEDSSHVLRIRAYPLPVNKDVRDHGIVMSADLNVQPDVKVRVQLKYEVNLKARAGGAALLDTVFESYDHGYVKVNGSEFKWSDYKEEEKRLILQFAGAVLKKEAEALVAWTGL